MRTRYNIKNSLWGVCAFVGLLVSFNSCKEYPDAFELTDGVPTIRYVRVPDLAVSDSLLTGAFLGNSIAIIGENLTSVSEIWFNDQKGVLNTSLITDDAMIVAVPQGIPTQVTDRIYFITKSKRDTVAYPFQTLVPEPAVASMLSEYVAEGDVATIKGNYFLPVADGKTPVVTFTPNIPATEVISYSVNEIQVVVPAGAEEGPVSVSSRYGTARSTFYFRDSRGMITNYDADYPIINSWGRAGRLEEDPAYALSGKYLKLSGSFSDPNEWTAGAESEALSHYWKNDNDRTEPLVGSEPQNFVLKFEANVLTPWSAVGLSFIFAEASTTNGPLYEDDKPRGIWMPWRVPGTYQTDGWVTVSIPLSEFKYNGAGESVDALPEHYDNLNIFLANRGLKYLGTACEPVILIDNLRVVPQ